MYTKLLSFVFTIILLMGSNVYSESNLNFDLVYGELEFERSCAICHGFNARGNGVMADSLKVKPTDLTILKNLNNGHFPFLEVYRVIEGSGRVGIHGTREMPVWGDRYREEAVTQNLNDYHYTRGLILELMMYIESIQE